MSAGTSDFGKGIRNLIKPRENFCFRVDASVEIGTGHFMRCLTLARELVSRGARVRFISRHLPAHLRSMLSDAGIECAMLATVAGTEGSDELIHSRWLGVTQARDAEDTVAALAGETWQWLVVDHYALDQRWERMLRSSCPRILVIDDLADRHHECDVLLDQNYYRDAADRYLGKVPTECQLLLGPAYALLRNEFRLCREKANARAGRVRRVLVFFGGTDPNNYTAVALRALVKINFQDLGVDVVVGAQHSQRMEIEKLCEEHKFCCHVQTSRMAELMVAADLAIGAGGSATWERCCLGLPTLTICAAFNQERQVADAADVGLLVAPALAGELGDELALHLRALVQNEHLRRLISNTSMLLVDARGPSRVLAAVGFSDIDMRIANMADASNLFEWRNHPTVRSVSRNPAAIAFEEHRNWLAKVLLDPRRILLIGERKGTPVGVVRFDEGEVDCEISIYLVPESKEVGLGQELLSAAERWIRRNRPQTRELRATVLGMNVRSQRLFVRAGYRIESTRLAKSLSCYA